jgi:hypothetical protein
MTMTPDEARSALLATIAQAASRDGDGFGREYVIKQTAEKLGRQHDNVTARLLMEAWDDLYRAGIVSHGMDLANLGLNWAHLTSFGATAAKDLSRDPSNPAGYRAVVSPHLSGEPIAESYLGEALDTYNKCSFKASAVMLGCAAEALHLSLRDKLVAKITTAGKAPPADLNTWVISRVLRSMETHLEARAKDMDRSLSERFEAYWPAWTGVFRMTRNDAGHPKSIDPVTRDAMHAALLLFPEQARLSFDLSAWVSATY